LIEVQVRVALVDVGDRVSGCGRPEMVEGGRDVFPQPGGDRGPGFVYRRVHADIFDQLGVWR
jgi:hypothetical protein